VIKHSPYHPKVQGLSLAVAAGTGTEKKEKRLSPGFCQFQLLPAPTLPAPVKIVIKLFFSSSLTLRTDKLECFSLPTLLRSGPI
jgi:hypothetical protein